MNVAKRIGVFCYMAKIRTCTKCGRECLATPEYFYCDKSKKSGFQSHCKICASEYQKSWREKNPDYHRITTDEKRDKNRERVNSWRKRNPEKHRALQRQWMEDNPQKMRGIWRRNDSRRRSRAASLPCSFTTEDEAIALDYFNGRCATCKRPLTDLFGEHTAAMDHWIPVSDPRADNPGTVPTNMVPLCHGIDGCNNKKGARDPGVWLIVEFGKRKAAQILERIETYFKSLGD